MSDTNAEARAWANSPEGRRSIKAMEEAQADAPARTYYMPPPAQGLLTFPDGQKRMFKTQTATLLAANDPRPLGLDATNWHHKWTPRLLYKTANGRYVSRVFQGHRDDRMEAVDLEEATRLYGALHFHGPGFDEAFDSQFDDA